MIVIKTYQDLKAAGQNEQNRIQFVLSAIAEHKSSKEYKQAAMYEKYYNGENPTIAKAEKIIYDMQGVAHRDDFAPNHKIASNFFGFVVDQEVSYLLGNGILFGKDDTLDRLGPDFWENVCDALESAAVQGVSFGYWNYDHLEVFQFADTDTSPGFVPLHDEMDGVLKAGIRYWCVSTGKPTRFTLYEPDGYTEYEQPKDENARILQEKQPYIGITYSSVVDGEITTGRNYDVFPIFQLSYKKNGQSEMQGKQATLDALDLVTSKLVNNVDDGNLLYWVLKNCNAMNEEDDAAFLYNLYRTRVLHANGDDGAEVEAHQVEAPFEGTENSIETLTRRLFTDFQAFDSAAVSAGNQTATAIKAAYVPLDLKVDKVERQVTKFINGILKIAGIDDKPTFNRNKIINTGEEIQSLVSASEFVDAEYLTKKVLSVFGDADQFDEVRKRMIADETSRFSPAEEEEV